MSEASLTGLRILLVEDEAMVAMIIEDTLRDLGCEVVGPIASIERAREAAISERVDGAFLDVNLRGELVYPVAEVLAARNVPFAFVTGYGESGIDPRFRGAPVLAKPFLPETVEQLVSRHMARRAA
ncbi:MAG TPA: response regulator [Alphaproteobacteria bacterium]|nr:response regulator [Alphaproteobacteria bacterium]